MDTSVETIKEHKSEQKEFIHYMFIKIFFPIEEGCFGCAIILVVASVIAYIIAAPVAYWGTNSSSSLITAASIVGIVPAVGFIFAILIGCVYCRNEGGANTSITISSCCLMLFGVFSLIAGIMLFVGVSQEPRDTYNLAAAISAGVLFLLAGIFHCFGCGCWSFSMQGSDTD